MSEFDTLAHELREKADELDGLEGMDNLVPMLREAADTIEGLGQKVQDLEGMLGELPPEGKCAMLLVKQVNGEYVWGCERYDFASYCPLPPNPTRTRA